MIWKWFWNTETEYYDEEITRDTDWGGDKSTGNLPVSGGRVQEWLKNEINGKFGVIRISSSINEQNFYSLEMFATKEDEILYDSDKEAYADRATIVPIPISTVQGDAFTATLKTSLSNTADIVVTDGNLEIPLNYRSIKITQIGSENANYTGTLIVQRSTDGVTWNTIATLPNALTPKDVNDTETYQKVNIGSYLVQGRQQVRVRASYTYINDSGEEKKTVQSGNVLVGNSVTKTELKLVLRSNFEVPIDAYDINDALKPFSAMYTVYGSVRKTMYVRITGSTGAIEAPITYVLGADVDSVNHTISVTENSAYGYMTHGVKKVEAWLEAEDGLGNTLKSDVLVNRFMVVNPKTVGADLNKPYLLLQNVLSKVDNFVQTEIAQYAVYSPSGENVEIAFLLTDYTEDYEISKPAEYFRMETIVEPRKAYELKTTVEIESEDEATELTKYDTYFRVRRITGDTDSDFIKESTNEKTYYVLVDNSNAYTPVGGSTFLLNPKTRNNSEDNPKRILNAKNNNSEVESVWTNFGFINDGWMTAEDGQKVLRIMAGSTLEIKKNVWAQFLSNPNSSMTFEIDCAIRNVTNFSDPIVKMFEGTNDSFKGLKMNALEGWLMNGSNTNSDNCLFAWQEDVRTHFSINLNHQVVPNKGDVSYTAEEANKANGTLALARVLVNGDCVREMTFKTDTTNEWCTKSEGSIIIGNEGADIDIYSIRIYEDKQLEATDILNRNYPASLATSEEKIKLRQRNNLLEGGRISLEKAKNTGLNCMVWHGVMPYHANPAEQKGWYEYFRYDQDGNYLPEYSGTNCKETKSLSIKGQGSTAKTYRDWNEQDDNSKVSETIQVPLNKIHSEIKVSAPYTGDDGKQYVDIYGGNLGKNAPIEKPENAQPYPYSGGSVTVPDGWIDGNGMYRGMGYRVAEGTSLAQKKVIKINYASSMQSHLIGACNTYDLLHRKVVGNTPIQDIIPEAVSAKRTEPFMLFNQEGDGNVYFKGMGTYGAGKADKVTWGYVKKQMPLYALIEGSDNNLPMTGFRVPFDTNTAVYDAKEEGWLYNGQQSFDFDLGATDDNDVPKQEIIDKWAAIHNFIYLHGTNIKYYNGTFEAFQQSDKANDTDYKYWCTQGDHAFLLKRYDFIRKNWINAGLWSPTHGYMQFTLNWDPATSDAYRKWQNEGSGDYAKLNQMFIDYLVSHMRKIIKYFINEKSLQFNYCYVLGFLAGTDNSDKNTYYKIDPIGVKMDEDESFARWYKNWFDKDFDFSSVHQLYFDGDDMDSIFRTNNNSHQTKPYYIDRLHPYADGNTKDCLYEGMGNQLFNYVEKAYEGTNELAGVMKEILNAATELVSDDDLLYGLKSGKVSLWGFLHKYFFNIQHYFPQIAYLEQARIRYEFPKLLGFISSGGGARNVDPITQSLGSQLQNELQYMNQRVIYMTSYAGFGAWGGDTTHSIGLSDANETFGFMPSSLPDGSGATYTFTVTPHQYIYPSYYNGQTFTQTHQRTSPSQTCTFTIAENVTTSDSGMGICGVNYYSSLGDLSYISITKSVVVSGKRLVDFKAWGPWIKGEYCFNPTTIEFKTSSLKDLDFAGSTNSSGVLDLGNCIRCKKIKVSSQLFDYIITPKSNVLREFQFGSFRSVYVSVDINEAHNLSTIYCNNRAAIKSLNCHPKVGINTGNDLQELVEGIYTTQKSSRKLESIHIENIDWTDFPSEALEWYCDIPTCEFKGKISIKEDHPQGLPKITWDLKNKIIGKFGRVDKDQYTRNLDLEILYQKRNFNPDGAKIKGNFYVEAGDTFYFEVQPSSIYENTQADPNYFSFEPTISGSTLYRDGRLVVYVLSNTQQYATVKAGIYVSTTDNKYVSYSISKTIEIWNRPAQVGDLVYADGTFSSAASWEGEKTPIGICFYVPPRDSNGNVLPKFANPNDKQLRLMVALEDAKVTINGEKKAELQWGTVPPITSQSDDWNAKYTLYDLDSDGNRVSLTSASTKVQDVYNILAVRNISENGLDNVYIDPDPTTNPNGESDYRDVETDDGLLNDGFRCVTPNYAIGDGFAYDEGSVSFDSVYERTLTADLAKLAGKTYTEGDIVNSGYAKTLKIIEHRNNLINSDLIGADGVVILQGGSFQLPSGSATVTEIYELGLLIDMLRTWASQSSGLNDAYPTKWQQLAYPFVSACYAYQPTQSLKADETLADKFKSHNWFAPTEGQSARICWYAKFGSKGGFDAFKDAREKGILGNLPNTSPTYWSVTENYSAYAWYAYLGDGTASTYYKSSANAGRAVASF